MAEMDSILLMMRLFFDAFFWWWPPANSVSCDCWLSVEPELGSLNRRAVDGRFAAAAAAAAVAEELSEGKRVGLASKAAARCLMLVLESAAAWPGLNADGLLNSCEVVNWRWNNLGPAPEADAARVPLTAAAGAPDECTPPEFRAVLLSWRWNIELAVNLDWCFGWLDDDGDDNGGAVVLASYSFMLAQRVCQVSRAEVGTRREKGAGKIVYARLCAIQLHQCRAFFS